MEKKFKNKITGAIALLSDFGGLAPDSNWELVIETTNDLFISTAARGCTLLEKLSGTWTIVAVNPSKGGEKGVNPILTLKQGDTTKRSYTHPSNIPSCTEMDGKFTWSIPKSLTGASTVTIMNGDPVFNW